MELDKSIIAELITAQRNEATEHLVYKNLSSLIKGEENKKILKGIAEDEHSHSLFWGKYSGEEVAPDYLKAFLYTAVARIFGITFGIKLMEKGEEQAQVVYERIAEAIPQAESIVEDEDSHEHQLLSLIDEEGLRYVGSVVLGLNDALVELTGALAGFTFTLVEPRIVAVAGAVTGIAASFSMAASEYLSTRAESDRDPKKAAIYTGIAYFLVVVVLVAPFLILKNLYISLGLSLAGAVLIILIFNFYISVAQDLPFGERFKEMVSISLGVSFLSFIIGLIIRRFLEIDI